MVSFTNAHCISGSPPEKVTPPPDRAYTSASFCRRRAKSSARHASPTIFRRPLRQTGRHFPQALHFPGLGHTRLHAPQCVQAARLTISCGLGDSPSGLWHHAHRSGHPFMNTVVRTPGPSNTANSLISNTIPSFMAFPYTAQPRADAAARSSFRSAAPHGG